MSYVYKNAVSHGEVANGTGAPWAVGFYRPDGGWELIARHKDEHLAAAQVHYLNGGSSEAINASHERRSSSPL